MKKKWMSLISLFLVFLLSLTPVWADDSTVYVSDQAGLLSTGQQQVLNQKAAEITAKYQCAVYIITLNDFGGGDAFAYAQKYYQSHSLGYGTEKSGVLLMLSMADRDYAILAYGYGNTAFTDYGKDALMDDHVLPQLKKNNYYSAFEEYLDTVEEDLSLARAGTPLDVNSDPQKIAEEEAASRMIRTCIVFIAPPLIALIVCLILRGRMKTAKLQRTAASYIPANGVTLSAKADTFLNRTVVRHHIQRNISRGGGGGTTINSSGFSGHSGKF